MDTLPGPSMIAAVQPAAEHRHLRLPLLAEREDQHLLVDVRVVR
jgi:hypothetical protein